VIQTEYMTFIHMPKSAGSFVHAALRNDIILSSQIKHPHTAPYAHCFDGRLTVATIRHPYTWWKSKWGMFYKREGHPLFGDISHLPLNEFVVAAYEKIRSGAALRFKKDACCGLADLSALWKIGDPVEEMRAGGYGVQTWRWKQMCFINGIGMVDEYLHVENLREELAAIVPQHMKEHIALLGPVNVGTNEAELNSDSKELIYEMEKEIFDTFDYFKS